MASHWEIAHVDSQDMKIYLSLPRGVGPFPSVVVAHHGGGVDQFIRDMADRLAADGYAAAALDLFHRITEEMVADGSTRIQHLSDPEVVADINATVEHLRNHPSVDGEQIGITGFCLGGRVVWLAAATNPYIRAAVSYYGGNIMKAWGQGTQSPIEQPLLGIRWS